MTIQREGESEREINRERKREREREREMERHPSLGFMVVYQKDVIKPLHIKKQEV